MKDDILHEEVKSSARAIIMGLSDWRNLVLNEGVLSERTGHDQRIVLWLPGSRHGGIQEWERISSVARAEIHIEQEICAITATAIQARQPIRSFLGKLVHRFRKSGERSWTVPNGEFAEQVGDRQRDLLLVWGEVDADSPDEARIKSRWPECQQIQKLGKNLYLVSGVESSSTESEAPSLPAQPSQESPVPLAENMLAAARLAGDRRQDASALTDLGILLTRSGKAQQAVALLEEALTLVRQFGDRALESDVLDNLGMAVLADGQPGRALELFRQGLEGARSASDQFAEKMALFHLGLAYSAGRNTSQAFGYLEQALAIAREVADREHEADVLWQLGIVHAEAGQRDQAVARCQEAVDLFKQMGNPQVDWLETQLQKFRAGEIGVPLGAVAPTHSASAPFFGGQIVAGGWTDQGFIPGQAQGRSGPGLLRMAFSAMKAMAHFAGSGFKATPASIYQKRLQTCGQCPHHTGLRCKLCGCFTSVKAWMPHERCPIGKWAA
jgi:tetratricopeptide (TPR) repeat protein